MKTIGLALLWLYAVTVNAQRLLGKPSSEELVYLILRLYTIKYTYKHLIFRHHRQQSESDPRVEKLEMQASKVINHRT